MEKIEKVKKSRTLILVKPDGVERGLIGEVLKRFENRGIKIVALKMINPSRELLEKHYTEEIAEKYGESIREGLIQYMSAGPVVAAALEGVEVVKVVRAMCGGTYPSEALPGTIRGDLSHMSKDYANGNELTIRNVVHSSGNEEDAEKELPLWFKPEEFTEYKRVDEIHVW